MKRTHAQITAAILSLLRERGPLGKTAITYQVGLSFPCCGRYLVEMEALDHIEKEGKKWRITEGGIIAYVHLRAAGAAK